MHSSRMRTARFSGHLYGGEVSASAPRVCAVKGGCLPLGPRGYPLHHIPLTTPPSPHPLSPHPLSVHIPLPPPLLSRNPSTHTPLHYTPPPMDRQTPVKTLPCPKLRLRAVKRRPLKVVARISLFLAHFPGSLLQAYLSAPIG